MSALIVVNVRQTILYLVLDINDIIRELRVCSPKKGTFLERQILVWHATMVIGSIIAIGLEK